MHRDQLRLQTLESESSVGPVDYTGDWTLARFSFPSVAEDGSALRLPGPRLEAL
jgi:hypothetical protein